MLKLKKLKVNQTKKNNPKLNLLLKYLPGFIKGEAIIIIGILILSFAYYKLTGYSEFFYYTTYVFIALGSFVTGSNTYKNFEGRGIISGFSGALPLALINLIIVYSFGYKSFSVIILLIIPLTVLSGALGGILKSNQKKRY